ncbi:MAG: DUF4034 domain-containing protein [Verrucomicrobiaceae bacterium]|nr:MAG: DUF4034 domain-containing protein [Verrucomicrobiaceae bacterium]
MRVAVDPVEVEIRAFSGEIRKMFNERRYADLEAKAAELRKGQALFGDGSWKIRKFYAALDLPDDARPADWKADEEIHEEWLKARPTSITPHVAMAAFQVGYAWQARGNGYASSVTEKRAHYFEKRLAAAVTALQAGRELPEKDPIWWNIAMSCALGQGWEREDYEKLVAEALAFAPTYHGYDCQCAYWLMPRWYGQEGEWEAYALKAAARKEGLGDEIYARIAIDMIPFFNSVFKESNASWPKTKKGLQEMRRKYPDSVRLINQAALLATMAEDQAFAKEMYELLGDTWHPEVFRRGNSFAHYRNWARTGKW